MFNNHVVLDEIHINTDNYTRQKKNQAIIFTYILELQYIVLLFLLTFVHKLSKEAMDDLLYIITQSLTIATLMSTSLERYFLSLVIIAPQCIVFINYPLIKKKTPYIYQSPTR